ncbi:MAG: polysaccharide biosynthesis tyrosine autokinase [Bacteroidetes bacterium]|nr:polysaccharide biosynthesis tyrosine autokinase [Bacteroidota bacterium]
MTRKPKSIITTEDIKGLWRIFLKNWYFFLVFPAAMWAVGYIYKGKLTEIYEAKTQILLKSFETYRYQEPLYRSLGYYEAYQDVVNQMRVIKSANLLSATITKLNLDVSYYIIGRLKTQEIYRYLPFSVNAVIYSPAFYENEFHLKIVDTLRYEIVYEKKGVTVKRAGVFGSPLVSSDYNLHIDKNPNYITRDNIENLGQINYMFKCHDHSFLINKFQSGLDVSNSEWSAIMEITLKDEIPDRAVAFLDTLSKEYIDYTILSQIQINENTILYIDRQMEEVVMILNDIEKELDLYKNERAILDLTREENEYFTKLIEHESADRKMHLQLQTLEALEKYLTTEESENLLPPSLYILEGDDYLKKTLNELYTLHIIKNGISFDVPEKNLTNLEINNKIQLLKDDLLEYMENTKTAINNKRKALQEQIAYYESLLRGLPRTQRQMVDFKRKLDVNEKLYSYLLERRANTIIARAGIIPETKVIESPYVTGTVEPNYERITISFVAAGFILSLILTFFRYLFFDTVESAEELKNITRLPILGDVPHFKDAGNKYLIVDANPRALISESYRLIRTNLEFFAADQKSKVVLITSHNPNEGKTFCVINLGIILAKANKKTIILEMDLHKPKMNGIFNLSAETGISQYLTGRSSYRDVILQSGIDNLDVIPVGTIPPNPSELILSSLIPSLIANLKNDYDYIIFDTPPIGMITDSQILMRFSDINVFIINARKTNKNDITATHMFQEENKFGNISFILNNVKVSKSRYYYRYYRYNYSYNYGYGPGAALPENGTEQEKVKQNKK